MVTCARGSSDHAATFARYLIETRLGVLTSSAAPSVSSVYEAATDLAGTVLLAISQSGASPDLLATVASARAAGARIVALVNAESSPLAQLADDLLPLRAGPERSVAATKSYIASLAAIVQLVASWAARCRSSPRRCARRRRCSRAPGSSTGAPPSTRLVTANNLYVIGRGLGLAVAQEAALKFKETCGLHAEALSAAELRHGPMALVRSGFPLLLFAQDDETPRGRRRSSPRNWPRSGADVLIAGAAVAHATTLPS